MTQQHTFHFCHALASTTHYTIRMRRRQSELKLQYNTFIGQHMMFETVQRVARVRPTHIHLDKRVCVRAREWQQAAHLQCGHANGLIAMVEKVMQYVKNRRF
jgi:hypothetical protein